MQTSSTSISTSKPTQIVSDKLSILIFGLVIFATAVFLYQSFSSAKSILFLLGVGLGIALLHAAFGFSGSWKNFIVHKRSQGVRSNLLLLIGASVIFFPIIGNAFGIFNFSAALGPVSISVFIGAFLFGIGMQLGGGCGSGTLFTFGQGQVDMLITLVFFIVGSTLGSAHLHWWLTLPNAGPISLISSGGWIPALALQLAILIALYILASKIDITSNKKIQPLFDSKSTQPFLRQLMQGPWPLWWGVVAILFFSVLTLFIAGHTWSITFAFGLWGTKVWNALGGNVAAWPYWSSGYPAQALQQSVLADTTSVMNFGIVLGAGLASAIAGKFAPVGKLTTGRVISAVVGGLLLGYGARIAFGCNIGAMFSGISTGSMHGWLWLAAAFLGNILGVQFRQKTDQSAKNKSVVNEN